MNDKQYSQVKDVVEDKLNNIRRILLVQQINMT